MTAAETPSRSYGNYDVEREIGRGAMGSVYLARDRRIGRRVALKTITIPDRQFEDATAAKEYFRRLQREAEVSGSLQHRNIVTLYEAGYENDRISFLAMELVEGETLQAMLKRLRPEPVPVVTALQIAEDILRGLAHAHEKSVVHRDIKPANILITVDGAAKIADFGIARPQHSSMTAAGVVMGTPNYMSPEQVLSQTATPRADIFSLGAMLYEMLTGTKPFVANDVTGILHNILRRDPPHVSEVNKKVPRGLGDLVARMLAKAPASRPFAAEALAEVERLRRPPEVRSSEATLTLRQRPAAPAKPLPFWERPVPAWLFAVTVALLTIGVVLPLLNIRARTDSSPTVTIAPEQIREFQEKRRVLDQADALFAEKKYAESLAVYESYLEKYPHSTAAQEGRDRARAAIEESKPKPKPGRKRTSSKDEDISPRELLDRLKKVFKP